MDGTKQSVLSELVNKDQGIENAGKALGIGNDGMVTPVPFSGTDFTGATASLAGTHGYVPAPAAGDQDKVLTGGGSWQVVPGAKLITVDLDTITNESGSYTGTTTDERVSSDMKPVMLIFGTPSVIRAKPTVTCNNGSITITCSEVVGTTTAQVGVMKVVGDPTVVTSTEFDILNNRIGTLSDLTTTAKTSAVDAINELDSDISTLNSKITRLEATKFNESVSITSHTTSAGAYTFPDDGYLMISAGTGSNSLYDVYIISSDSTPVTLARLFKRFTEASQVDSIFVRKGTKAYVADRSGTVSVDFRRFKT